MNLDIKFIFDGKPPAAFNKALQKVSSGKYRTNPKQRAEILNLRALSDFFSGEGAGGPYQLESFVGFLGGPNKAQAKAAGYANPASAPDIQISEEDLRAMLPPSVANQIVEADRKTGIKSETIAIELKQTTAKGKYTETVTEQQPGKSTIDRLAKATESKSVATGKFLMDWFLTKAEPAYRTKVISVINQKFSNLLSFTYVDEKGGALGKPKATITPGAAAKLNLGTGNAVNRQNFAKYINIGFTGSRSKGDLGSLQFELNNASFAVMNKASVDITKEIGARISQRFATNLIAFYTKGGGQKLLTKAGIKSNSALIDTFAELILLAQEFDPDFGGKAFQIRTERQDAKIAGAITSAAKLRQGRKKQSEKQRLVTEVQLTALAQKALQQRMPQGQPGGPPDPTPGILTSRTGRFIQSAQVLKINERKRTIFYTYDPIYRVHEEKYKPTELVTNTIREVAQQQFGVRYALFRR